MEAEDKGRHWECEHGSLKLELGSDIFFIPDLVAKGDVFLSMKDAAGDLKMQVKRDIKGAQNTIQGLYGELASLENLLRDAPELMIE